MSLPTALVGVVVAAVVVAATERCRASHDVCRLTMLKDSSSPSRRFAIVLLGSGVIARARSRPIDCALELGRQRYSTDWVGRRVRWSIESGVPRRTDSARRTPVAMHRSADQAASKYSANPSTPLALAFVHGSVAMTGLQFALWGAFGGFAVEALQFYSALRSCGDWPWRVKGEPPPGPLAASVAIRVSVGLGLAAAAGATGQVAGPIGAIAVGVAAPLVIEQMARHIPATEEAAPSETSGEAPAPLASTARTPSRQTRITGDPGRDALQ